MVEEQLRRRGIRDERVLTAMSVVPRHEYVPAELWEESYEDHAVSIGQGQTISQPYMVAVMTEALELKGTERVLEVGAGSGYQAAVLSHLAGHVYTIENDAELFRIVQERLTRQGLGGSITVVLGDGSLGYPPAAPYGAILVAAAAPQVPDCYMEQLVEGGLLVIPVGSLESQDLLQLRKCEGQTVSRELGHCRFVPLTGSQGWQTN
jgi:protein-L-isoaspartate(D-aspartate) O-methyltransferase